MLKGINIKALTLEIRISMFEGEYIATKEPQTAASLYHIVNPIVPAHKICFYLFQLNTYGCAQMQSNMAESTANTPGITIIGHPI